jgi:S1-C subfamily serine protease
MKRYLSIIFLSYLLLLPGIVQGQDLRKKFGTTSSDCAMALNRAITQSEGGQHFDAYQSALEAFTADPSNELAAYWVALTAAAIGKVDETYTMYQKVVALAEKESNYNGGTLSNVAIDACINLGLLYGRMKDGPMSGYWFSKAILLDLKDSHGMQWKAWRNMAITSHIMGDNLSAAMQAAEGREIAPNRIEDSMVDDFFNRAVDQPSIQLLHVLKAPPPAVFPEAKHASYLTLLEELSGYLSAMETPLAMVSSTSLNRLYLFYADQDYAVVVNGASFTFEQKMTPLQIKKALMPYKKLFAITSEKLFYVLNEDLEITRTYPLPGKPSDFDVCMATSQVFLLIDEKLNILQLDSGKVTESEIVGQKVAVDSQNRVVYTFYKESARRMSPDMVIVGGRPVFFHQNSNPNDDLDLLIQSAYTDKGDTKVAAFREKAAWNPRHLTLSPDNKFIAVTGGGGYRGPKGGGYGVGIIPAHALGELENYYPADAYPVMTAFNPVTSQVALLCTKGIYLFHRGHPKATDVIEGEFSGPLAWSPDGTHLFAVNDNGHTLVFENKTDEEDRKRFVLKQKELQQREENPKATASLAPESQKSKWDRSLRNFEPASTLSKAIKHASKSVKENPLTADALPHWTLTRDYTANQQQVATVLELYKSLSPKDAGVTLYQTNLFLKDAPEYIPAQLLKAECMMMIGGQSQAIPLLLQCIQEDAGRTSITTDALRILAVAYARENQDAESLSCFAWGLEIDPGDLPTREAAVRMLNKHDIAFGSGGQSSPPDQIDPLLNVSVVPDTPLSGEEIYASAVSRTVVIETNKTSGSGVFISRTGHVLTCSHVVPQSSGEIRLTYFRVENGKITKEVETTANRIWESKGDDLALLRIKTGPELESVLPLATQAPKPGTKVYALGSPGMGNYNLRQTLSEGIIASADRIIAGQKLIQHTAAVNPGNSGGPLLSPFGEIIGIVTSKAELENVSFAIPAARIIEIFKENPQLLK